MTEALGLSIPLFDEQAVAEGFVRSVHQALTTALIPHTLILVNNGSTDGTPALVNCALERVDLGSETRPAAPKSATDIGRKVR